ncbi:MAG: amylo-alpha-1,6-glucosidase [Phycisphaerae bacterium]
MTSRLLIDLTVSAWSSAGSYLQVRSPLALPVSSGMAWPVRLQSCRRSVWGTANGYGCGKSDLFDLHLIDAQGERLPYRAVATADELRLEAEAGGEAGGAARLVFCGTDAIAVRLENVGLRLEGCKPQGWWAQRADGRVMVFDAMAGGTTVVSCNTADRLQLDHRVHTSGSESRNGVAKSIASVQLASGQLAPGAGTVEAVISLHSIEPGTETPGVPNYAEALRSKRTEIDAWMAKMPPVPAAFEAAAQYAWHTLWHHRVGPSGLLERPAVIMGRLWMNITWPWDAAFAALGVGSADIDLAFDQLMLHFDHQADSGQICDHLHDAEASFGFLKPPVQGLILRDLLDTAGIDACRHRLGELYEPMGRWTDWWYRFRDDDADGMCQYHHGNDSGWDNATLFDQGMPTEGVDLAAYLVIQCEQLGRLATILNKPDQAAAWQARADRQLATLLEHGVHEGQFVSVRSGDHHHEPTMSLMPYLPILLGKRLPKPLLEHCIAALEPDGEWLTAFGPATESPRSDKFLSDSYWRGPVWAPPTWMIFRGLVDAGRHDHAAQVALRFCRNVARQPGMHENYAADDGRGLRCPTYAWTAAVFIRMAEWLPAHAEHPGMASTHQLANA